MIANILTPLDGSSFAERAVPYAAALARATHARLRLLHVQHEDLVPSTRPLSDTEITTMARIDLLAGQLREAGIQATAKTLPGFMASRVILAAAHNPPADLIVLSTHGRSGIGRWLYGSVADEVLRQSEVPVLLVPASCHATWPQDRPLKILVPLDGSDLSESALGLARMIGHTVGAALLLLRVAETGFDYTLHIVPAGVRIEQVSVALDEARHYLDDLVAGAASDSQAIDALVDEGDPATVITATARTEGVDLIVMATHGRTGLPRLTMGSVATATLQHAQVPILMVRPIGPAWSRRDAEAAPADTDTDEIWPPIGAR